MYFLAQNESQFDILIWSIWKLLCKILVMFPSSSSIPVSTDNLIQHLVFFIFNIAVTYSPPVTVLIDNINLCVNLIKSKSKSKKLLI